MFSQAFEDVSAEDMPEGEECAICKDTMAAAKKLPCGHMFHVACLRMWLDQSGSQQVRA